MPRKRPRASSSSAAKRNRLAGPTTQNDEGRIPSLRELEALGREVLELRLLQRSLGSTGTKRVLAQRLREALQTEQNTTPVDDNRSTEQHQASSVSRHEVQQMIAGSEARLAALIRGSSASASIGRNREDDNISLPSLPPDNSSGPSIPTAGGAVTTPTTSSVPPPATSNPTRTVPAQQPPLTTASQPPAYPPLVSPVGTLTIPPVPQRLINTIVKGEFVDFGLLVEESLFHTTSIGSQAPDGEAFTVHVGNTPGKSPMIAVSRRHQPRPIVSFAMWMEAWCAYVSVFTAQYPLRALEMLGYQRIITMAAKRFPTGLAWLRYDVEFRTLAARDKTLRWDVQHPYLWMQCMAVAAAHQQHPAPTLAQPGPRPARVPCTYCSSTTHFPDNCPKNPFRFREPRSTGTAPATTPRIRPTPPQPPPTSGDPAQLHACRDYNNNRCFRGSKCRFPHVCSKCGGTHIYADCPWGRPA